MASGDNERKLANQCIHKKPWLILGRLVDLIEHPISESAIERQIEQINNFISITKHAFWLHDIPKIIRLYEAISKKIDPHSEFRGPFKSLLGISAFPPLLAKFSDKEEYSRDFSQYFSTLGYLIICIHDNDTVNLVLNAISSLLTKKTPEDTCFATLKYRRQAAENSRLPEIVSQLLEIINEKLYDNLLEVTILLSEISKKTSRIFAETNAITYLLTRLGPNWQERKNTRVLKDPLPTINIAPLENTCRILWRLLNSLEEENQHDVPAPDLFALRNLQYAFRWTLINKQQKVNRNNLAGIILKMLDYFPSLEIEESGIADDIVILSVQTGGRAQDKTFQFAGDDDFQFKKIVLMCLTYFFKHNAIKVIQERHVIIGLLLMLSKDNVTEKRRDEHHCQLIILALKLISKVVPYSVTEFIQASGLMIIVKMIDKYLQERYTIYVLESSMNCLNKILELEVEELTCEFDSPNVGTANTIINVINEILKNKTLIKRRQNCIARGFCILQHLAEKGHREANITALDLCIIYLKRIARPADDETEIDPKVTICALHYLWTGILCTESLASSFLLKGGIYILLDIIKISTFPVKLIATGALADICEKSSSVPYLITWRKRRQTILPLLLEVFRGEVEGNCGNLEERKEIFPTNTNKALNICFGKTVNLQITKSDLLNSCRPKVQAILVTLKMKYKEKVDIANEQYRLYDEELNTDDQLSMLFAENYSGLRMCEAWVTIAKDLMEERIVPADEDFDSLKDRIDRIQKWKLHIRRTIEEIVDEDKKYEHVREFHFYNTIKEAKLSDALDALQELKYISNCTEKLFQMRKKMRLSHEVDNIRLTMVNADLDYNYHKTMTDLPFTNIYNQRVSIESNLIMSKADDATSNISLVSSDENISVGSYSNRDNESLLREDQMNC